MKNNKISRTKKSNGPSAFMVRFWRWKLNQQMRTGGKLDSFTKSPSDIAKFLREENIGKRIASQNNKFLGKGKKLVWRYLVRTT